MLGRLRGLHAANVVDALEELHGDVADVAGREPDQLKVAVDARLETSTVLYKRDDRCVGMGDLVSSPCRAAVGNLYHNDEVHADEPVTDFLLNRARLVAFAGLDANA